MRRTLIVSMLLLISGCSYYRVTDPSTSKIYYTKEVKYDDGATLLKDAKTGNKVTIQNSEVEKITEAQFKAAVGGD
ncbi:MAG TPA: hypothetical protein PLD59_01655 [Tepidisphaeraceae bacterium]|nr:hypothetical protein [Tepidisphaeraceae bacterium]